MPRRLQLAIGAACLLLCMITILVWARSYFYADTYIHAGPQHVVMISSAGGVLALDVINSASSGAIWPQNRLISMPLAFGNYAGFFKSLIQFNFGAPQMPMALGLGPIKETSAPFWSVAVFEALFPAWIYFRSRKRITWTLGQNTLLLPVLRWRVGRFAIFSAVGTILGAVFGWLGTAPTGPRRPDFMLSPVLLVLPGVAAVLIVVTRRRVRWHQALLWLGLELGGFVCFFQAISDQVMRHSLPSGFLGPDIIEQVTGRGRHQLCARRNSTILAAAQAAEKGSWTVLPAMRILPDRLADAAVRRMRAAVHAGRAGD